MRTRLDVTFMRTLPVYFSFIGISNVRFLLETKIFSTFAER
jgi:hypothetical protein